MLNHYKLTQCMVPATAIEAFSGRAKFSPASFTANDAKFVLLLLQMTKNPICKGEPAVDISPEFYRTLEALIHTDTEKPNLLRMSESALCGDQGLQLYLWGKKYLLHPCNEVAAIASNSKLCDYFRTDLPPAYEDLQLATSSKTFVGSAIPADIVHHVYGGDSQKIFSDVVTYKVLFAEYFTANIVFSFIGTMEKLQFKNYEITLLSTNQGLLSQVKEQFAACASYLALKVAVKIFYLQQSLEEYSAGEKRFDFIEYNGGLSKSNNYMQHLSKLKDMLTDKGVIGVTYFTDNKHVSEVRHLLDVRNHSAHVPFSVDPLHLITGYLELNDLNIFKEDGEIITLLGGEQYRRINPPQNVSNLFFPVKPWKTLSRSETENILSNAGLKISSRLPTAYANPFEEVENYEITKFKSFG